VMCTPWSSTPDMGTGDSGPFRKGS
jgi:hypothetical protein